MSTIDRVEAPVTAKAYLMCAFSAFAGMLFGYDSGYIASVLGMAEFKKAYGSPATGTYTTSQKGLIVAILSCGTFCGAIISGSLADRFGRRTIIIAGCLVFLAGVVIQVAHISIPALVVGRLVAGFGVGFVSAVNILYMSEVAPRHVRGAIVSSYQFAITLGIMLASCVGYATQDRTDSSAFRIPIGIQFLWALVLIVGLLLLPESPRYFVKKGRLDLAMKALARLRGQSVQSEGILDELAEIQANFEYEQRLGEVTWLGCFSGSVLTGGSNARKVLIVTFLQEIHVSNPFLIGLVTTIVNVASTPVSFYTIERFGRRPLLIYGALAMMVCEMIIAIVGLVLPNSQTANYCLITFVCLYVFFFASTWGPAAWVVVGEIFQLNLRSKGVALSTASNWFWNCIIAIITPYMVDGTDGHEGLGVRVFFIWGALCAACAIFAYAVVPESKGLTLEQVDRMMEEVSAPRSGRWRACENWARDLDGGRVGDTATIESIQLDLKKISVAT
ncbi:hypothetical protein B0A54_11487 [Friedmanniomyces endolithicus]|uniref:Major facilitator superfamily (MFS) profile domain-containing protein n=1 Tax=Friedmanniomyces endolithicus TaxID=329885 RepID=A0A4V5N6W6_9PEZI|nr:hypothetical protein B0A54_11487 [Friedmanniomyces endolithicus]